MIEEIKRNSNYKYFSFINADGKKWTIPIRNAGVALEIYQPSSIKGTLLKKFLPLALKLGFVKYFLSGEYVDIICDLEICELLEQIFGKDLEYSIFWGTPGTDQKITIQIFRNMKILGYCKLASNKRIINLFSHEKTILELLNTRHFSDVPKCLKLAQISDDTWMFVQSTEKKRGSVTTHYFGNKHRVFLKELFDITKQKIKYENTDYYSFVNGLPNKVNMLQEDVKETVLNALCEVNDFFCDSIVEWGMVHGDFTPWNTCLVSEKLYGFDFEYALYHAPNAIDYWHFQIQSRRLKKGSDTIELSRWYKSLEEKDDIGFKCYILFIIMLYINRGNMTDIEIANQQALLYKLIYS